MDMTLRLPKSHLSLSHQRKSPTACLVSLQEQNQVHSQQTLCFLPTFFVYVHMPASMHLNTCYYYKYMCANTHVAARGQHQASS